MIYLVERLIVFIKGQWHKCRYLLQIVLYNLEDKCNKANRLAIACTIHQDDDRPNSLSRFSANIDRTTKEQSIIQLYQKYR